MRASGRSSPTSAFAYIDSRGRRRLPINDEAHVRNALARFGRVAFEDDAARERARTRLLNAAKKYGIVPVGFITGQLRDERRHATAGRLVIELGREGAPGELQQRLRKVSAGPAPRRPVLVRSGRFVPGRLRQAGAAPGGRRWTRRHLPRARWATHDRARARPAVLDDPDMAESVMAAVRFVVD